MMDKKILLVPVAIALTFLVTLQANAVPQPSLSPLAQPYPAPLAQIDNVFNGIAIPAKRSESTLRMDGKSKELPDIKISHVQANYYSQHGKYWRGAATAPVIPTASIPISVNVNAAIHGYPSWADMGINMPNSMDVRIKVGVYTSPLGRGYVIIGDTILDGVHLRRALNVGPEEHFTHGWITITNDYPW